MESKVEKALTLRQLLRSGETFVYGAELVTTRGSVYQVQTRKVQQLGLFLSEFDPIHFVSITDNPGGSARISPENLGMDLAYRGKNVVIHLSCKDLNRNGLESRSWDLASMGLDNILALSGDYPVEGYRGSAQGVFDLDSIGLLRLLREMNDGLKVPSRRNAEPLTRTHFFLGAAVTNFKRFENEVMPQYFKLEKKLRSGADFIVTQLGFDSQKFHELLAYMRHRNLNAPALANIYVLSPGAARAFNSNRIPGCVVPDELLAVVEKRAASPDKGRSFFLELAAKQIAVARGLGYRGAYLAGIHEPSEFEAVLRIAESFQPGDWREFARDICYSQEGEFFLFERVPGTGLIDPERISTAYLESLTPARREEFKKDVPWRYRLDRLAHGLLFEAGRPAAAAATKLYRTLETAPAAAAVMHGLEHGVKRILFDCRDCGDCSLPEIAYLCPESKCAKNERNGPCGGTYQGMCEVYEDMKCIWSLAYDRLKPYGEEADFVVREVVIKNGSLNKTSAWANFFLGRDHHATANHGGPGAP